MKVKIIISVLVVLAVLGFGYYHYKKTGGLGPASFSSNKEVRIPTTKPTIMNTEVAWSSAAIQSSNPLTDITSDFTMIINGKSISLGMVTGNCLPAKNFTGGMISSKQADGAVCFPKTGKSGVAFGVTKVGNSYEIREATATKIDDKTVTLSSVRLVKTVR
jgi:hypothetical protein